MKPFVDVKQEIIDEMNAMDEDEFRRIIDLDIRDDITLPKAYTDALRSQEICERWYYTLLRMKKSTELTIAAKKADDKARRYALLTRANKAKTPEKRLELLHEADDERAKYLKWVSGAIRFNTGVELRLNEASYCRRVHYAESYPANLAQERDLLSAHVRALLTENEDLLDRLDDVIGAVERHQRDVGKNARPVDRALWAVLDDDEHTTTTSAAN